MSEVRRYEGSDGDYLTMGTTWVKAEDHDRVVAELRANDMRYRWLRERQSGLELEPECEGLVFSIPMTIGERRKVSMSGEDVDAVIDAAIFAATAQEKTE